MSAARRCIGLLCQMDWQELGSQSQGANTEHSTLIKSMMDVHTRGEYMDELMQIVSVVALLIDHKEHHFRVEINGL